MTGRDTFLALCNFRFSESIHRRERFPLGPLKHSHGVDPYMAVVLDVKQNLSNSLTLSRNKGSSKKGGVTAASVRAKRVQGYLAHKKTPTP